MFNSPAPFKALARIAKVIFPLILLSLVAFSEGINQHYSSGLTLFQTGKFAEAAEEFQLALKDEPSNPRVLFNLGLTEYKLQKVGLAMGIWRRAQYYKPGFRPAEQALKVASEGLKVKGLPHQITLFESYRGSAFFDFEPDWYLFGSALFLFLFGWSLIGYLGRRKRIGPEASFPISMIFFALLFGGSTSLASLKIFDNASTRATVVVEKVEARSGPSAEQASLFDLFEGFEVIVRQSIEDDQHHRWFQVSYPGGMTGWVMSDNLILHSETTL